MIARRVAPARGLCAQVRGLIGKSSLPQDEGLWLDPCSGVHTFGMRFPIDLLVLDQTGRVLRIVNRLQPWRVSLPVRGGRSVVELAAGAAERAGLAIGDTVTWASIENVEP
jgi:uncharacterized protein